MRRNTTVAEKHPFNFPNSSDETWAGKSDLFTIRDGRYVGSDEFVVPRDFAEFYERFPRYVSEWVAKHWGRSAPREDLEDWSQDLLAHLSSLPLTSKHRESGKKDVVATYDPLRLKRPPHSEEIRGGPSYI